MLTGKVPGVCLLEQGATEADGVHLSGKGRGGATLATGLPSWWQEEEIVKAARDWVRKAKVW